MSWIFIQDKGLKYNIEPQLDLFFGKERIKLRSQLNYDKKINQGRSEAEDSYEKITCESDWVRLTFENNILDEIEILKGVVQFEEIKIEVGGNLSGTLKKLKDKGISYFENELSYTIPELKLDLGDSEKNGGLTNEIEWIYTSKNIDHLINE